MFFIKKLEPYNFNLRPELFWTNTNIHFLDSRIAAESIELRGSFTFQSIY